MEPRNVLPLVFDPGTNRDGTQVGVTKCVDSQHVRWRRRTPVKIGGRRLLASGSWGYCRGLAVVPQSAGYLVYFGTDQGIFELQLGPDGLGSTVTDRTPTTFVGGADGVQAAWSFDVIWDATGSSKAYIIAHQANENTFDLTNKKIWYGEVGVSAKFIQLTNAPEVSGGITILQPIIAAFGNYGLIQTNEPNNPTTWTYTVSANTAHVAKNKFLCGLPVRGGNSSPSGLFVGLNSIVRANFVGGSTVWAYDTISSSIGAMSHRAICDVNGQIFIVGHDGFYMYGGTVQKITCNSHQNWFFELMTQIYRSKVWCFHHQKFNEVWIFHPRDDSGECTHALIWNYADDCWYDTILSRTAGSGIPALPYALTFGYTSGTTQIWLEDYGVDEIIPGKTKAIAAYFETPPIGIIRGTDVSDNVWTRLARFEPDFIMSGSMTMKVKGYSYPNSDAQISEPYTFTADTSSITPREQRRLMRLIFESNTEGGTFWMGVPLLQLDRGDVRGA